jgi:RNA polymerase sigma-70 factor, ECF subfamily
LRRRAVGTVGASVTDAHVFAGLAEAHRSELRVHCQRIVGSYAESEDLVQETLLRAWRNRRSCHGRASFRAWLYRIATNVCLDFVRGGRRRDQPRPVNAPLGAAAVDGRVSPNPDRLLADAAAVDPAPDEQTITRETIDLLVAAAITHLPARQQEVLILRDLLGWPAADTAAKLGTTIVAVNSALRRARAIIRQHLPADRAEWPARQSQ